MKIREMCECTFGFSPRGSHVLLVVIVFVFAPRVWLDCGCNAVVIVPWLYLWIGLRFALCASCVLVLLCAWDLPFVLCAWDLRFALCVRVLAICDLMCACDLQVILRYVPAWSRFIVCVVWLCACDLPWGVDSRICVWVWGVYRGVGKFPMEKLSEIERWWMIPQHKNDIEAWKIKKIQSIVISR